MATDPLKYETFLARHDDSYMVNHNGSAEVMGIVGKKRIFQHCIEKHGLHYVKRLTDGDSKSFPAVEDFYKGVKIEKLECIDHIQKWVENRLRNLKKNVKGLA